MFIKFLKITYVIVQFGTVLAQDQVSNSITQNKDNSNKDTLNIDVDKIINNNPVELDSSSTGNLKLDEPLNIEDEFIIKKVLIDSSSSEKQQDSTFRIEREVDDSLNADSTNIDNISNLIDKTKLVEIKKKYSQLKIYLRDPKNKKTLIIAGIAIPTIYLLLRNNDSKKEVIGSPPEWPS